MKVIVIGNREIAIEGIGKLFFQEGLPIAISLHEMQKRGVEVSLFHIADECLNNGWKPKTVYNKLVNELEGEGINKQKLQEFCFASYEGQRKMIFDYLFRREDVAIRWFDNNFSAKTAKT